MKLIEPKVEIIKQGAGFAGMIEHVDRVAGVCYGRQTPHATYEEQLAFVQKLINRGEWRPLEFATVKLILCKADPLGYALAENQHTMCCFDREENFYITTNLRVLCETFHQPLEYVKARVNTYGTIALEDECNFFQRPTIKITCSRAVADEARTHVTLSSLMKSTRYCKFDDLEIAAPRWLYAMNLATPETLIETMNAVIDGDVDIDFETNIHVINWLRALSISEYSYQELLKNGMQPQEARGVLPMDMATELVMCGFSEIRNSGWDRFCELRISEKAHPDMQYIAKMIKDEIYGTYTTI